ncbi:MAG: hypothetical protein K2X90_02715 [Candidatus Babeliaceae bacterium]|nr:hypothetical protein [Candidatus Babeliaceae bacterium]
MTHWGWYWKVKKKHKPRISTFCSFLDEIDSFSMFKNKEGIEWVRRSPNRLMFEVFNPYKLKAVLLEDDSIRVTYSAGSYTIPVERKPCNYGGSYYFFHCPLCDKRMRKLYCLNGQYQCRTCANLGYYTQRLRPSERYLHMSIKIEDYLKNHAGTLKNKPPWMKRRTFNELRRKYVAYDEKRFYAINDELRARYGAKVEPHLENDYGFFVPSGMYDAYDFKE